MPAFEVSADFRSVVLPIEPPVIMPRVQKQMAADNYQVKDEFHLTVIGSDYGRLLDEDHFASVTEYFDTCNKELEDVLQPGRKMEYSILDALYEIDKPKIVDRQYYPRHSLVALVSSIAIIRTIDDARYATNLFDIPQPFLHVTVATKPDTPLARRGIGIASEQEWKDLQVIPYETEWLGAQRKKQ